MEKPWTKYAPYAAVVAATLLVVGDWWNPYLLFGHSSSFDYSRMLVLHENVSEGVWWPRFAEAFYHGYGSPIFHYYAPLGYWLTELPILQGVSISVALKITMGMALLFSGLFVMLLAKEFFGAFASAGAGVFYVLSPYHLTDILVRHALAESLAFVWLPLALLGVLGAVKYGSIRSVLAGAAGVFLLLLTHSITAMISAPLLFMWWGFLTIVYRKQGFRGPFLGCLSGISGLLLSAFFWLPAFVEKDLVWSEKSLTEGYFLYSDHFVYLTQLFSTYWDYGVSVKGSDDTMSFQLGMAHWATLVGILPVIVRRTKWRGLIGFWVAVLSFALIMCLQISQPIWIAVPLLKYIQFPWRFLLVASLASSLLAGAVCQWLFDLKWCNFPVGVIMATCLLLLAAKAYAPMATAKYMASDTYTGDPLLLTEKEMKRAVEDTRFVPAETSVNSKIFRDSMIAASSRNDWLPVNVLDVPQRRPEAIAMTNAGVITGTERSAPCNYRIDVDLVSEGTVLLNRFWFPGWVAKVDGRDGFTFPATTYGVVAVTVPAGDHQVSFSFQSTPLRKTAWGISFTALISIGLFLVYCKGRDRRFVAQKRSS